ncbi:MAG TPA: HNH endonuclease domain-containing protein [Verrucomicrobiae bacterium]
MNIKKEIQNEAKANLQLAFDVGHSSIGWAVLEKAGAQSSDINILGCGSVVFRADDCLVSSRRAYRRQRRHIRSTRQRIARMKILLQHLGVLTKAELDKPGCAWPWKLAAQILQGGKLLAWPELWDVLRWYAHNRGYDGNRRWSAAEADAQSEDSEKEANARTLMGKFGTKSMAETFCAMSGLDPLGKKKSTHLAGDKRPKGQNAAFPREIVEREVRRVLQAHFNKLQNIDADLERTLLGKDNNDKLAWRAIPCSDLKLPKRYEGGLLFGQLVPRFDNRIISTCPISGQKVPTRNCPEFLNFRWAMQLANIRVGKKLDRELHELTTVQRTQIDRKMRERGYLTPGQLKDAVRSITASERDNLETMFMHPDAKEALLVDPVQKLISSDDLHPFWNLLPERLQKRLRGQWRRNKTFTLSQIRQQLESLDGDIGAFDVELQKQLDAQNTKAKKKDKQTTRQELLQKHFPSRPIKMDGRAAYARHLLVQAHADVLAGKPHPKEEGGCLFITEEIRQQQLNRTIADQTNNHLVRHRLIILERLLGDIIKEYAEGKKDRIGKITIEVNRDLREMSGKNAKEKAQDLGLRIANHHHVTGKLEKAFGEESSGKSIPITAGLIRKARIADDLGWRCPYTGIQFEPKDLVTHRVDKDHIVPRSERASDSLDSLAITFSAINKWKGKRTAWQFISDEQGKSVPDLPNLSIVSLTRYKQFVESLETYKGHDDDKRRKKKRKELLLLPKYEEKEFTPRDLTQTSQLVRLGAQVLKRTFTDCEEKPTVVSLPGSVTGTVRKAWRLLGCLSAANPQVLDANGNVKSKTDIRDITHLHHALDACVLGLSSHFIPNNGNVWELIVKRNPNDLEKRQLAALGIFGFGAENRFEMHDLAERLKIQIRQRVAEKRVIQHVPARMDGLRVEQNTWRVITLKDDEVILKQRIRQPDGSRPEKITKEKPVKLLGLSPQTKTGKLAINKGVLIIPDNFGVALDPQPTIISFHKVWPRLQELKKANGGKVPRILRNGQLIQVLRGSRAGIWRVMSTKDTEAYGIALDLSLPDRVKLDRGNAPIEKLIQDGLKILDAGFVGIDSSRVTIAEAKKRPRKLKISGTDESCPTISSA